MNHRGLTKKLDFEKGKLKAKGQKPDYQERFAEEGDRFDRGGSEPARITMRDIFKPSGVKKELRYDHGKAVEVYFRQIRGKLLRIGGWKFKFKFTAAEFARENGIGLAEGENLLPNIKADAEDRMRRTRNVAARAQLEGHWVSCGERGETRVGWRLRFRTFLPTFDAFDWSKVYHRVEICPYHNEGEGQQ